MQRDVCSALGFMLGPGDLKIFKMQSLPLRTVGEWGRGEGLREAET